MEMAQKCSLMFDLQLFAEEPAATPAEPAAQEPAAAEPVAQPTEPQKPDYSAMTPDQVSNLLSNYHNPAKNPEPEKKTEPPVAKTDGAEESEPEPQEGEQPDGQDGGEQEADLQQVFRIKENGQDKEYTLAQLIDKAQKGENYERHMQDLAIQRKAFELAQQQPPKPPEQPKPEDRLQTMQQQAADFAQKFQKEFGMDFNPYDPTHMLAFQNYQMQQAQQKLTAEQQQQAQLREYDTQENRYRATVEEVAKDKNFVALNQYAEKALFLLPQKGPEGVQEFQGLYKTYQKIQQRQARFDQIQQTGQSNIRLDPFTAGEIDKLSGFYDNCKKEFYAKQFAPKSADKTKKPTQTEKPGGGTTPAAKPTPADYSHMSKDDVNKVLNGYLAGQLKG